MKTEKVTGRPTKQSKKKTIKKFREISREILHIVHPRITRLYVDGYKNLIDCSAELHDLTVLVGPNNSGKSNFLEVFSFIQGVLYGSEELKKSIFSEARTPRGVSACHLDKYVCRPILFSISIEATVPTGARKQINYDISIQCSSSDYKSSDNNPSGIIREELNIKEISKTGRPVLLFKREAESLKVRSQKGNFKAHGIDKYASCLNSIVSLYPDRLVLDRDCTDAIIILHTILSSVQPFLVSPEILRHLLGNDAGNPFGQFDRVPAFDLLSEVSKIYKNDLLYKQFKDALCQILELDDVKFEVQPISEEIRRGKKDMPKEFSFFTLKMPGQLYSDISSFSDGTLVVTAILVMLLSPERKGPLICIEEPENCLHPRALKTLMSFIKQTSKGMQVLISTHSPYLLNFISPEDIIVVSPNKNGETHFAKIENIKEIKRRLRRNYLSFGDLLETDFKEEEAVEEVNV